MKKRKETNKQITTWKIHNLITNLDFVFSINGDPAIANIYYSSTEEAISDLLGEEHEEWEEMFTPLTEGETYENKAPILCFPCEPWPKRVWTNGCVYIARLDEDF